ncbi:MAG: prepilin-type N-terminal cleavage/methylation domain-containing protein [Patescibacteria group bacterium]|nr:prepilin-type N-terminal cleavage/methylation domain-containing protein [Patescibacteria group bacterium]
MKNNKGFTLIELLVVIVIIGILATLATVALSSARGKARDARRVSDVKQIMTALEMYYNDAQGYPASITPGSPIATGNTTFMAKVPFNASPYNDNGCGLVSSYSYSVGSGNTTYTITYCLGGTTGNLSSSSHTASPAGIE